MQKNFNHEILGEIKLEKIWLNGKTNHVIARRKRIIVRKSGCKSAGNAAEISAAARG